MRTPSVVLKYNIFIKWIFFNFNKCSNSYQHHKGPKLRLEGWGVIFLRSIWNLWYSKFWPSIFSLYIFLLYFGNIFVSIVKKLRLYTLVASHLQTSYLNYISLLKFIYMYIFLDLGNTQNLRPILIFSIYCVHAIHVPYTMLYKFCMDRLAFW